VKENLAARSPGRAAGVGEDRLNPALSWSRYSLFKRWNESKDKVAPWWREVSMHLSMRVFECQSCGASLDRDVNAARNVAREGARLLAEQRGAAEQHVAGATTRDAKR
jgi:hypothetical protein